MLPPAVLWIDPGGMTGLAAIVPYPFTAGHAGWHVQTAPEWFHGRAVGIAEFSFNAACSEVERMCDRWNRRLAIGWERFDINSETHKKTRDGTTDALHAIGVCRYLAEKYDCRVLPEAQQHTPSREEQRQLKALGWWVPGKDDAQSAACHMLRYLMRVNELTPAQRDVIYGENQPQ